MYDVLLVLFIHSSFSPETIGRHTWTVYKKHCCWHVLFFPHAFWVSLFKWGPASNIDAAGSACRERLFAPSSQILGIDQPFLVLRTGATAGPPISHSFEETLRETRFSFEVSWLPFMKWEPSLGLVFFCTFCSYCQCKVCKCALPVSRISPRARASGLSWAECIVTQSEMQLREV